MTEEQRQSKFNLMKTLSIVCLAVVIISGFLPWVTLGGDYKDGVLGEFAEMAETFPEDQMDEMQDMLDDQDIDIDIEDFANTVKGTFDPLMDGAVSPMDFLALHTNFNNLVNYINRITEIDKLGVTGMDAEMQTMMTAVSSVFLVPAAVFGVLALAALVRLVLRVLNRRGLGVFVAILAGLNGLFMTGVAYLLDMFIGQTGDATAAVTPVPLLVFVCSILSCVFWAQARKLLNPVVVKETVEIPVPQNIPTPQNVQTPQNVTVEVEEEVEVEE